MLFKRESPFLAKQRAPMAKPVRVWPMGTRWNPLTINGWVSQFGRDCHCTSFKKIGCYEIPQYIAFLRLHLKPNYFKKQRSSSIFLLTWSRRTGSKWPWSHSRLDPCLKWMEVDYQVLHGHFGPVYLLQVSKMMIKNIAPKSNLALVPNLKFQY